MRPPRTLLPDQTPEVLPASPEHASVLAAIHAEAFAGGEVWDASAIATYLALPGVFALFDPAGALVIARVAADEAEILALGVAPPCRRRGQARRLLAAAEREAAHRGAARMFLEVAEGNLPARALYAQAGYREVARRPRYYGDGEAALVLARALTGGEAAGG